MEITEARMTVQFEKFTVGKNGNCILTFSHGAESLPAAQWIQAMALLKDTNFNLTIKVMDPNADPKEGYVAQ